MIRFENVSKCFAADGREVEALKDVSLHIEKGKIVGIIGFSGAGKSTLVRCINLLERPTEGKIYIGDTEVTALKSAQLRRERRRIGMIFQQFNLFASRTVFQNVAFPLQHTGKSRQEIRSKVEGLLELVGLSDKKDAYPSQLSGGQKQRVAIARALATDPEILLSDESTSALDPQTTRAILKLLKKLNAELGITIVMITHEMQVVKEICSHVVVMEDGRKVEEGEVFDIFANPREQITRNFVASTTNLSKVYELLEEKSPVVALKDGGCIVKFQYLKKSASEALVSYLSRTYDLDINIIFGNIEQIGENPIGGLVSIINGDRQDIEAAMQYLRDKNVGVEVIADAGTVA